MKKNLFFLSLLLLTLVSTACGPVRVRTAEPAGASAPVPVHEPTAHERMMMHIDSEPC